MVSKLLKKYRNKYHEIPVQAKLAMWLMFSTLVQKGISLITVPLFTRMMDTAEYGKYSAYLSWLNIFSIICSFQLAQGVYNKGLSKYKNDQKGFALAMQYTTSCITVVVYIIYLIFRNYINKFTGMNFLITSLMFVEIFFSTSMGFWSIRQQYEFKYKSVVSASLFYAVLNPLLGYIFVSYTVYLQRGTARIFSTVLAQVIVGVFFYIVNMKSGKFKANIKYSIFALKFNLPLVPHYFSEYILNQSDRIMIQKLCGYTQVAFYSVAYNAAMLMSIITNSMNQAIVPWVYQSLDKKNIDKIGNVLMILSILIMFPMVVFIALAPEAIYILAGKKYASAVYVIPPVAGSVVFLFLYTILANIEFYYDYNKFTMYISMIGAIANIILNFIFIKLFGYVAAGYTSFFCYFLYFFGHYLFAEHIIKQNFNRNLIEKKQLIALILTLLLVMICMSLVYKYTIVRYAIILMILIVAIAFKNKWSPMVKSIKNKTF